MMMSQSGLVIAQHAYQPLSPGQPYLAAASQSWACILGQHRPLVLTRPPADGDRGYVEKAAAEVANGSGKCVRQLC